MSEQRHSAERWEARGCMVFTGQPPDVGRYICTASSDALADKIALDHNTLAGLDPAAVPELVRACEMLRDSAELGGGQPVTADELVLRIIGPWKFMTAALAACKPRTSADTAHPDCNDPAGVQPETPGEPDVPASPGAPEPSLPGEFTVDRGAPDTSPGSASGSPRGESETPRGQGDTC